MRRNTTLVMAIATVLSKKFEADMREPLARCAAARDGECSHAHCPQKRDNEPATSARHCPLDHQNEED